MSAYVYRVFTGEDLCLYVGATGDLQARFDSHIVGSAWAAEAHRFVVTEVSDMTSALSLEAEEIRRLRPIWNIKGRGPRHTWQLSDYAEVILAVDARRHMAWKAENSDRKVLRLLTEMRRRFPDVGPKVAADLEPHLKAVSA